MSSYLRRLQRKAARTAPDYETRQQPVRLHDTAYEVLHPTRGWQRFSMLRETAQRIMAGLLDHVLPERQKTQPATYGRKDKPVPPPTVTRQQRRAAARGKRAA